MPSVCDYNCTDLPEHEQIECGDNLSGGIAAVGILECDHTITDFTSTSEWNTNIASGKATIVRRIRGEKTEPSPVEVENPNACGSDTVLDTFDRQYEFTDDNVSAGNVAFYDALNGRTTNLVVYHCKDEDIEVVDQPVTWVVRDVTPRTKKERRMYMITAKWTSKPMPALYDAPAGIFT